MLNSKFLFRNDLVGIQDYSVEKYDNDESCIEYCGDDLNCSVME